MTTRIRETESGPNLCKTGGWRIPTEQSKDTPTKNPKLRPGRCSNCVVDMYCGDCDGGKTFEKNDKGIIEMCISKAKIPMDAKYIIIHEMVHAQQLCDQPPNTPFNEPPTRERCCALEYYPYLISCKAQAEDGLFDENKISIEECAAMLSDTSCDAWPNACTKVKPDQDKWNELIDAISEENPQSCQEAINNLDTRAASIRESMKLSCAPGCPVEYENSIGNNLCYIGQCVEESIEQHRIIPGRIPYVTQDEAFPWDACTGDDPQLGSFITIPPLSRTFIPPYRNPDIVQQLDILLCQTNGHPKLTPPVLCAFNPQRRISLPTENYYDMAVSFLGQGHQQTTHVANLQMSNNNIGARYGTRIYVDYLHKALLELSEIIKAANTVVFQIGNITFPQTTCPRYFTGDCRDLKKG